MISHFKGRESVWTSSVKNWILFCFRGGGGFEKADFCLTSFMNGLRSGRRNQNKNLARKQIFLCADLQNYSADSDGPKTPAMDIYGRVS